MKLTPQQEALAPVLQDHLASGDKRAFIIEGLSGVGKSTLVQQVLAEMGKEPSLIDGFGENLEMDPNQVAVVDYFDPEQVLRCRKIIGEATNPMILLAHPRFTSDRELGRVDHVQGLEAVGIPSVLRRLNPMNDEEAAAYAGQKPDVIREFGLGIGGHIRTLMKDPLLNDERATVLTTAKLHQILGHAERFHQDHIARAEALLGRPISHRLGVELESTKYESLEKRLAGIDLRLNPILPRHPETLRIYKDIVDFGGADCWGIDVFVPHVEPAVIAELGLMDGDLKDEGHIMKMAHSCMKAWVVTRTHMDGGIDDRRRVRRAFDEWVRGEGVEHSYLHNFGMPTAGENPLWIHAGTHGGFKHPDTPLFTYAAETLLQAHGIPYSGFYGVRRGVAHHVTKDGVKLA